MCAKKKADGFVFIKHDSRSVGPPPPLDDPLPGTRQELMYEFRQLLNALHLVQDEVTGSRGLIRDPALPFRFMVIYNKRMQRTVVGLRDGLREVHSTAVPQIDGKAVQSYCKGVVDLCADRLQFLMQFVRVRRGDPAGPSVEELADQVVQSLLMIRESWSFEMLDVDDLWEQVQWEIDQLEKRVVWTEPLTSLEIGSYFKCHRNQVKANVLDRYEHKKDGPRYRLRAADMPAEWHVKHGLPIK